MQSQRAPIGMQLSPPEELNKMINMQSCMAYSIQKQKHTTYPTLDNKRVSVRETAPCPTHWPCCFHMVVPYMIIIYLQSHSNCNQYATKYGNMIQVHVGTVFEHSPISSHKKHGGLFIKRKWDVIIVGLLSLEHMKILYIEHIHNKLTNGVHTIDEHKPCPKCAPVYICRCNIVHSAINTIDAYL